MPGPARDWDALARNGKLESLKVGELKEYCKEHGLVQAGEKGTLMFRIKAHVEGKSLLVDGKNPANLKPAELKKACATRGLSPMGYPDELLEALMGYLKKHGGSNGGESAKGGGKGEDGGDEGDAAVALASRILELSEEDKWASILSLGGQEVTRTSPTPLLRKAYLQLSRIVHPDRLQHFPQATQAFQALVAAFERLTSPEQVDTEEDNRRDGRGKGREKVRTISRSNEGCFRTTVLCPRCKEEWGTPVQGLPPYAYNYFMTGLKTYCCSTCLLEFGTLTATHLCPFCRKPFDYDPQDYHRKITCPNPKCKRDFGFVLHTVSDRVEKEMRTQLKLELEQRLKAREGKLARLARSHKRKDASGSADDDARLKERIFIQGLADECPRCGEVMECASDDVEAHRAHLQGCRDRGKIEAHHKRQKVQQAREAERAEKEQQQEDLRSLRTWEFLGADDGTLWLLSEEQLAKQCRSSGLKVDSGAGKDQLVARLMEHRRGSEGRLLTDGTTRGARGGAGTRRPFSRESLPTNLHAMSLSQLRAVCAAHGFTPKAGTAAGVVKEIEAEMARGDEDHVFLITG